jgi:hypothetical protein
MKLNLHSALYLWLWNMLASMTGCLMVLAMVFGAMIRFSKRLTKEEHIRGARLVDSQAAMRYLKENKVASDLRIAGVPLYAGKETSHVILRVSSARWRRRPRSPACSANPCDRDDFRFAPE